MAEAQVQYKDRLFSFIFGNEAHKEWTLSLYNAVNSTAYDDPEQIVITTIREALYLGMHNDVSFMIADQMNMYEQQSTFNPNMPLRMLQYAGSLYEKDITLRGKNKYSRRIVPLPVPKMVVFYNGLETDSDERTLKLSDAFDSDRRHEADIQVRVRMINVNHGHNRKMMEMCRPLSEYAWVVDRIRTLERNNGLEAAIGMTIDELPRDFLIRSYLEGHRAEVKTMLLTEYNEAKQMEQFYQEGREEGRSEERTLLTRLMGRLAAAGRLDDIARASTDQAYLDQLIDELHLI